MTHHLTDKIEATRAELQAVVNEHNELVGKKQELLNKATELQGALKVLVELDGDQPTNTEGS